MNLYRVSGFRHFHPFRAIAKAVNSAPSLCKLTIVQDREAFSRDPSGLVAFANALREHTTLEEFMWIDSCDRLETAQVTTLDPVLRVLPACSHLRKVTIKTKCASTDAVKNLPQLRPATFLRLVLETEQWLAVVDEIRQGHCNVQKLILVMLLVTKSKATKAVKSVGSAIRLDCNLKHLTL